jgi:hypothetical protein
MKFFAIFMKSSLSFQIVLWGRTQTHIARPFGIRPFPVVGANLCVLPTSLKENKRIYCVNQRHYRHMNWDSELQSTVAGKYCLYSVGIICFLIRYPSQPIWSHCLSLLTDLECTDSPRLHYIYYYTLLLLQISIIMLSGYFRFRINSESRKVYTCGRTLWMRDRPIAKPFSHS